MLIYKSPLVSQSVGTGTDTKYINSCWLYAPSIAQCSSADQNEFLKQKNINLQKFTAAGISEETLEKMILEGAPCDSESHDKQLTIMGLTKEINFMNITGSFSEYEDATNEEKEIVFNELLEILKDNGPMILEYPAFGSESIHRSAVTGVVLGKNSKTNAEEICLIYNDTMDSRLKGISVFDLLEVGTLRKSKINFYTTPEIRENKPEIYSRQEFVTILKEMPTELYNPNLKIDFSFIPIDTLVDIESRNNISIFPKINNQNGFFEKTKKENEKTTLLDKDSDDPNCCPIL